MNDARATEYIVEVVNLRAENERLKREIIWPLLEHYLNCCDGNEDALAIQAKQALENR
jgi:hypothetical protein